MEIGLVYSSKDPRQQKARDFVRTFVQERGILARIVESDQEVESPIVIINGQALTDLRRKPRSRATGMFPDIKDIAKMLEEHVWSL